MAVLRQYEVPGRHARHNSVGWAIRSLLHTRSSDAALVGIQVRVVTISKDGIGAGGLGGAYEKTEGAEEGAEDK
jgi:hypothetical protein